MVTGNEKSTIYEKTWPEYKLRYTLALPEKYASARSLPLVVALHWGGPITPFFGRGILEGLVEPALRELGAIIMAPDCPAGTWTNEQSETAVITLLDLLQSKYPIDSQKIILTGYSLGGIGTWYLAARHQERFAIAIPMAGKPQANMAAVSWRVPLYILHSAADEIVPLKPTQLLVDQLKNRGVSLKLTVLENIAHHETYRFVAPLHAAIPWIRRVWQMH